MRLIYVLVLMGVLVGCASEPGAPITTRQAKADLEAMAREPVVLERPVLVLSGYSIPGFAAEALAQDLREATGDGRVYAVTFFASTGMDASVRRVMHTVEQELGSGEDGWSPEVDVIGYSMGGVVARYAATERASERNEMPKLRIRRLFTLCSPHQGARMAWRFSPVPAERAMARDSAFLAYLDESLAEGGYEVRAYAVDGDEIVGSMNSGVEGEPLYVLEGQSVAMWEHMAAVGDSRFSAEFARLLRGEGSYFAGGGSGR